MIPDTSATVSIRFRAKRTTWTAMPSKCPLDRNHGRNFLSREGSWSWCTNGSVSLASWSDFSAEDREVGDKNEYFAFVEKIFGRTMLSELFAACVASSDWNYW